jgi:hypothetical protein
LTIFTLSRLPSGMLSSFAMSDWPVFVPTFHVEPALALFAFTSFPALAG